MLPWIAKLAAKPVPKPEITKQETDPGFKSAGPSVGKVLARLMQSTSR